MVLLMKLVIQTKIEVVPVVAISAFILLFPEEVSGFSGAVSAAGSGLKRWDR